MRPVRRVRCVRVRRVGIMRPGGRPTMPNRPDRQRPRPHHHRSWLYLILRMPGRPTRAHGILRHPTPATPPPNADEVQIVSAHKSLRHRMQHQPTGRALLTLATTALISGVGCLWATVVTPSGDRILVAACLSAAAVLLCGAVAVAAYRAEEVRVLRGRMAAMDASVARPAAGRTPALGERQGDGGAPSHPPPEGAQPGDG